MQARQVNMGTGLTQIFITGEEASLEDISVASTEVSAFIKILTLTKVTKIILLLEYPIPAPPDATATCHKTVTWRYLGNPAWYHSS